MHKSQHGRPKTRVPAWGAAWLTLFQKNVYLEELRCGMFKEEYVEEGHGSDVATVGSSPEPESDVEPKEGPVLAGDVSTYPHFVEGAKQEVEAKVGI